MPHSTPALPVVRSVSSIVPVDPGPRTLVRPGSASCAEEVNTRRRWLIALLAVLAVTVTGCANDRTMMGGPVGRHGPAAHGYGGATTWHGSMMGRQMMGRSMMGSAAWGRHMSPPTCTAPSQLGGTTVRVMVGDMGMTPMTTGRMMGRTGTAPHMMLRAAPASVPAGEVSFAVRNMGSRAHELVVLPLASGQRAGERAVDGTGRVDESGSLGEASASCASGAGEGIEPGTMGWVTLDLPPGHYELVCNLPHHYANGMYQEIVVR